MEGREEEEEGGGARANISRVCWTDDVWMPNFLYFNCQNLLRTWKKSTKRIISSINILEVRPEMIRKMKRNSLFNYFLTKSDYIFQFIVTWNDLWYGYKFVRTVSSRLSHIVETVSSIYYRSTKLGLKLKAHNGFTSCWSNEDTKTQAALKKPEGVFRTF